MSIRQVIMILGAIIFTLPSLGFPTLWDNIFIMIAGIVVILLAYRLPSRKSEPAHMPFVEDRKTPPAPDQDTIKHS